MKSPAAARPRALPGAAVALLEVDPAHLPGHSAPLKKAWSRVLEKQAQGKRDGAATALKLARQTTDILPRQKPSDS